MSGLELTTLEIEWVPREQLQPNDYNPNVMTEEDRLLLRQSILEDGWTQPIITLENNTIVDGEQRWQTSAMPITPSEIQSVIDKIEQRREKGSEVSNTIIQRLTEAKTRIQQVLDEKGVAIIADITGGYVPRTIIQLEDRAHMMISTVRHNRARGQHRVRQMATIVQHVNQLGLDDIDLKVRLGMTGEEVRRFLRVPSNIQLTPNVETDITKITDNPEIIEAYEKSEAAGEPLKAYYDEMAERDKAISEKTAQIVQETEEKEQRPLSQPEKDRIARKAKAEAAPAPEKPQTANSLRRVILMTTPEAKALFREVMGVESPVNTIMKYCNVLLAHREEFETWRVDYEL